jgi:hypothetical protein
MDEILAAPVPDETVATCHDCAMCRPDAVAAPVSFRPELKCCTYVPDLPNFIVGRILLDDDPASAAGRATVVERIRAGICVTPLGLGRPYELQRLYAEIAPSRFGRAPELRCPHYQPDSGDCGIWQNRNAICTTWFCKHSRGALGKRFWMACRDLLLRAEAALASWCQLEMGFERELNEAGRQSAWASWSQREEEYYRECARRLGEPNWAEVVARSGPELQGHVRGVQAAFATLVSQEPLPAALQLRPVEVFPLPSGGRCGVVGYGGFDPLAIPVTLFRSLRRFDGRPTAEAVESIRAADGLRLSEGLVRKLVDFEILAPVPDEPAETADRAR